MSAIRDIFAFAAFLFTLACAGQMVDDWTRYFATEAAKSHKKGLFSLKQWNNQLHGYDVEKGTSH